MDISHLDLEPIQLLSTVTYVATAVKSLSELSTSLWEWPLCSID